MAGMIIESFTEESVAKAFFANIVEESPDLDGVFVKSPMRIAFAKNDGGAEVLGDGDVLYVVMALPKGTGLQLDTTV